VVVAALGRLGGFEALQIQGDWARVRQAGRQAGSTGLAWEQGGRFVLVARERSRGRLLVLTHGGCHGRRSATTSIRTTR
jgi:hypothetical protein